MAQIAKDRKNLEKVNKPPSQKKKASEKTTGTKNAKKAKLDTGYAELKTATNDVKRKLQEFNI